jgi:hypothetical protein
MTTPRYVYDVMAQVVTGQPVAVTYSELVSVVEFLENHEDTRTITIEQGIDTTGQEATHELFGTGEFVERSWRVRIK